MADDPIRNYQAVRTKLDEMRDQINQLVKSTPNAPEGLQTWWTIGITGTNVTVPVRGGPLLDITGLPTGAELARNIREYHRLRGDAVISWQSVPFDKRAGLRPPP